MLSYRWRGRDVEEEEEKRGWVLFVCFIYLTKGWGGLVGKLGPSGGLDWGCNWV